MIRSPGRRWWTCKFNFHHFLVFGITLPLWLTVVNPDGHSTRLLLPRSLHKIEIKASIRDEDFLFKPDKLAFISSSTISPSCQKAMRSSLCICRRTAASHLRYAFISISSEC